MPSALAKRILGKVGSLVDDIDHSYLLTFKTNTPPAGSIDISMYESYITFSLYGPKIYKFKEDSKEVTINISEERNTIYYYRKPFNNLEIMYNFIRENVDELFS